MRRIRFFASCLNLAICILLEPSNMPKGIELLRRWVKHNPAQNLASVQVSWRALLSF